MEFQVNSKILSSHLNIVYGAIGKNPVLPILENFLFDLSGNQLKLVATDLETTIISTINVEGVSDGKITIPANLILQTIKGMGDIMLTILLKDDVIEIISLTGNYKCQGHHHSDFPTPPDSEGATTFEIGSNELKKGFNSVLFATSNDDLRLAMTGVFMKVRQDGLTLVTTDAFRLVEYKFSSVFKNITNIDVILPKSSCSNLDKILGATENVSVSVNKSNAFFKTENTTIITRLIDAKFPQYESIIPTESTVFAKVSKKDILGSLKRTMIYSNKSTHQVMLYFSEKELSINAIDYDLGNEAKEKIKTELMGTGSFEIAYNAKFLSEVLSVIDEDSLEFEMTNANKATIINVDTDVDNTMFLIMPVLIGN